MNNRDSSTDLLGINETLVLQTLPLQESRYKAKADINITPLNNSWNYKLLTVLLNQLHTFHIDPDNGFRKQSHRGGKSYTFSKFVSFIDPKNYIIIHIENGVIEVKGSKQFVDPWHNSLENKKGWITKETEIDLCSSSRAILKNASLLYYPEESFTLSLFSFVSSFVKMKIDERTEETSSIYDLFDTFIDIPHYESIDFENIKSTCEGYLLLNLTKYNNTKSHLDKIVINENEYFILGGTYLSPFASSLVQSQFTNGILLDTTWALFKNYVTSIPTAVIQNVGQPLGFTFGLVENVEIYNSFFEVFENCFGYRITEFILVAESDQGVSLKSFVESQGIQHLYCLRHLLCSLGKSQYSSQVGNLVKAVCEADFNSLRSSYENSWKDVTAKDLQKIRRLLKKTGLDIVSGRIIISDQDRWVKCSMKERYAFKMPSCTNSLESAHGHMNSFIPRRNNFWASLKRLIEQTLKRNHNFKMNFIRNYANYKRKIQRIVKSTPPDILNAMIHYYKPNLDDCTCSCGETSIFSSMLGIALPCSHLHYLNVPFPDVKPPKIEIENITNGVFIDEYVFESTCSIQLNLDYFSKIYEYVYQMIKHYSHRKKKDKDEIDTFVRQKLKFDPLPEKFALGYPVEVFEVIDEGISKFYKKKNKLKY